MQSAMGLSTTPGSALVSVASYSTYREAQQAVDKLSDARFPVERSSIVAEGLSFREQVTGRLSWGRAFINGAWTGGITGVFIGAIFGLLSLMSPLASALSLAIYGFFFGAVIGGLFGLLSYAVSGGQRDFTSISGMQAERYQVMVESGWENEARRILGL